MKSVNSDYRDIAWNGVRLKVPPDWEVSRIGLRYLFFEDDAGPALEIKWGPVKGRFSHHKQLDRLASFQRPAAGKSIRTCDPPAGWEKALNGFDTRYFRWQGNSLDGKGALAYCAECRNAMLIQLFRHRTSSGEPDFLKTLSSLKDHSRDGRLFWCIYDIRAITPPEFGLVRYRLDAGVYELALEAQKERLFLHRWGPAGILLKNRDLETFARTAWRLPSVAPNSVTIGGFSGLEWRIKPSIGRVRALWTRIRPGFSFESYRVWHETEKNRILGIALTGKQSPPPDLLETLSTAYETI